MVPETIVPKISFEVSRVMNEFCHLSVLYSDCLPVELSSGMLGNGAYQSRYSYLKDDDVLHRLQSLDHLVSTWTRREPIIEILLEILHQGSKGWDEIWTQTGSRLKKYKQQFESVWAPISDHVLSRLAQFSRSEWTNDEIHVHFVDCLNGGFAWNDSIAFATLPDLEVQKKFLAHELSELITPCRLVEPELKKNGLDPGIAHTITDMLAYISVKDFIAKPVDPKSERRGVVPNKNYYPKVEELLPIFEDYSKNASQFRDFESLIQKISLKLKTPE